MGGKSSRFGSPKAFVPFKGASLAAHILREGSQFSSDVFAVCRTEDQVPPDAAAEFRIVTDQWKEEGPLSGLHAALLSAKEEVLFLTGVDMPFLKREVVEGLFHLWRSEGSPAAVVPRHEGRWEPLCSIWSHQALRHLEPGQFRSFQDLIDQGPLRVNPVSVEDIRRFDPSLWCLLGFNTREEWERFL
jgi:molybdopterin-guanine dinucleotide biosynthesis protein A